MGSVDDGLPVKLSRKRRPGFENFTSSLGLGCAECAEFAGRQLRRSPFAPVQIKEHHLVTEVCVSGDGATATVFRIARVSARDNYFELVQNAALGNRRIWFLGIYKSWDERCSG